MTPEEALPVLIAQWNASHLPPLRCGGCRRCCLGDTIWLQPGENPAAYKTRIVGGRHQLRKGRDGNCIYLGKSGCKIHAGKPLSCRLYDCRIDYARAMTLPEGPVRNERLATPPVARGAELMRPS